MSRLIRFALLLVLALAGPSAAFAEMTFPALSGRVVDQADLLDPAQEAALTQKLAALETQSGRQVVVATLPSLQGYEIEEYGYQLGRNWGLGDKDRKDGALLIVAPNERKVRIEIGYGLEGVVTDALSGWIIRETILPRFKAGDMAGGIIDGTDRLIGHLALPDAEARAFAANLEQESSGGDYEVFIVMLIIFFVFILPMIRAARKGGRRYGSGPIIIWGGGSGGGGGSSSWGGSDFGGGGFSGGGGSFGGGGASGSW